MAKSFTHVHIYFLDLLHASPIEDSSEISHFVGLGTVTQETVVTHSWSTKAKLTLYLITLNFLHFPLSFPRVPTCSSFHT